MTRERFEELVGDFAEGTLQVEAEAEFAALLAANSEWRVEALQERDLVNLMRSAGRRQAPAALARGVSEALAGVKQPATRASRRTLWQVAAVAALLIGGVIVFTKETIAPTMGEVRSNTKPLDMATKKDSSLADEMPAERTPGNMKIAAIDRLAATARASQDQTMDSKNKLPGLSGTPVAGVGGYEAKLSQSRESGAARALTSASGGPVVPAAPAKAQSNASNGDKDRQEAFNLGVPAAPAEPIIAEEAQAIAKQALPARETVRSAVIARAGRVLVDTPWYETASRYSTASEAALPQEGRATNTRFIIAQVPSVKDANEIPGATILPNKIVSDQGKDLKRSAPGEQVRVLVAYNVPSEVRQDKSRVLSDAISEKAGAASPMALASATSSFYALPDKSDSEKSKREQSAGTLERDGRANIAQAPAPTADWYASFDAFYDDMKVRGAQFLFYTADRAVAFSDKTPEDTPAAQSNPPTGKYTGFIVFHFRVAKQADAVLVKLPTLTGPGVRNVGVNEGELVAQPDGVRLVMPYKIDDGGQ